MTPYYDEGGVTIYQGDSRELAPSLAADVVVTDPPYGLAFMGKAWDRVDQQFHQAWAEAAYQALPPGGWLLAFGGTRTWHRLACGIEDAGFEVRDTLMWLYGSGFPKGKACLKPGWEPILLARKPGSNVLQIDASRIDSVVLDSERRTAGTNGQRQSGFGMGPWEEGDRHNSSGRWPANVVLTHGEGCNGVCEPECPVFLLDQQSGNVRSSGHVNRSEGENRGIVGPTGLRRSVAVPGVNTYADQGGASRFFYTAKAGRNERVAIDGEQHPTVKPLALMRWLVRLVTPPGGTVLDPFCGSGSTLVAAALEGFRAVGVEADERWCKGSAQRVAEIPPVQESLAL